MGIAIELQQWINAGRDYHAGVDLYVKYGSNPVWKRVFGNGSEATHGELLGKELNKLAQAARPPQETTPERSKSETTDNIPDKVTDKMPDNLADKKGGVVVHLEHKWKPAFKEAGRLLASLDSIRSGEKLGSTLLRIRELFEDTIEPAWQKIDYFEDHGSLPPALQPRESNISKMSVAEMYSITKRLPSRITKHRNALKRDSDEEKAAERLELIKNLEIQLAEAKALLENAKEVYL